MVLFVYFCLEIVSSDLDTITPEYFNKLLTNIITNKLNLHAPNHTLGIIYRPNAP